jgi:bifunctional non-homologous end joining protein LigD
MTSVRPRFIAPMMALLAEKIPAGPEWSYEVKLDGIRAIAVKEGRSVTMYSRKPRDITVEFPAITEALAELPTSKLVLDGEIIVLDADGRSSFQLLQNRRRETTATIFVIFDVLHASGRDITSQSLAARRKLLKKILPQNKLPLRLSPLLDAEPKKIWSEIKRLGLEGIIAKRKDSTYESGRRSGAWQKIKAQNEQEFVIGGFTEPRGSRKFFGAILVGYYSGKRLLFASGVGTGFSAATLRQCHQLFQKHRIPECPFTNLPAAKRNRFGGGLTAAEMRRCTWLKPVLVCQVKFYEWTRDGNLRQPVFMGLREDKKPTEVVRESPK